MSQHPTCGSPEAALLLKTLMGEVPTVCGESIGFNSDSLVKSRSPAFHWPECKLLTNCVFLSSIYSVVPCGPRVCVPAFRPFFHNHPHHPCLSDDYGHTLIASSTFPVTIPWMSLGTRPWALYEELCLTGDIHTRMPSF